MRCPDCAGSGTVAAHGLGQVACLDCDGTGEKYSAWITEYGTRVQYGLAGLCRIAVDEMVKEFPELQPVCGHVFPGRFGHWWCVDAAGNIVDPTRSQFDGEITYEPWTPGTAIRCGKCRHCGDEIWAPVQEISRDAYRNVCDDCGGAR